MSLKFNTLLNDVDVPTVAVQLVRHQALGPQGVTPFRLWKNNAPAFQYYQSFQKVGKFSVGFWIASFVVSPTGETIFVGLYENAAAVPATSPIFCPVQQREWPADGFEIYNLIKSERLAEYEGRLAVKWGDGFRSWVQRACNKNKVVEAIYRAQQDPPFPGLHRVLLSTDELETVPESWRTALAAIGGIYLLVCERTGEQYVGSAYGEAGFWGRWLAYSNGGHGGNTLLKSRGRSRYLISILDTSPISSSASEVIALEGFWKGKLGSRAHGLNAN